jgi:hypothetical protein
MSSFQTRFVNLPNYVQKNIIEKERKNRLKIAQEKGINSQYANANLQSLAAIRAASKKSLFNQLANQGTQVPPNVETQILSYLGTKTGQTPNSVIRNITSKKKKEAHNAMVLEKLLEAQTKMEAEQSEGWQQHLRVQAKNKSRAKRGKNYNFRNTSKKNMYKNKRKTNKNRS